MIARSIRWRLRRLGRDPAPQPCDIRLADGTPIRIRPINGDDKQILETGLAQLSERSRTFRFLWPKNAFSAEELRAFTEVDYADHVAVAAIDLSVPGGAPVGVGRFIRLQDKPEMAEVAVTILDCHQGRGLGRAVFAFLASCARQRDLDILLGLVHADNVPMQRLFTRAGGHVASRDGEVLAMLLPLRRAAA